MESTDVTVADMIEAAPEGAGSEVDYTLIDRVDCGTAWVELRPDVVNICLGLGYTDEDHRRALAAAKRWTYTDVDSYETLRDDCDVIVYRRTFAGASA